MKEQEQLKTKIIEFFAGDDTKGRLFWQLIVVIKKNNNDAVIKISPACIVVAYRDRSEICRLEKTDASEYNLWIGQIERSFEFNLESFQKIKALMGDAASEDSVIIADLGENPSLPVSKQSKQGKNGCPKNQIHDEVVAPKGYFGNVAEKRKESLGGMTRVCKVCGRKFVLTKGQVSFYERKNLCMPKRCQDCINDNRYRSDEDYYSRGLHRNGYQDALELYGPRINVNGGIQNSPGFEYSGNDGNYDYYERNFAGKTRTYKK